MKSKIFLIICAAIIFIIVSACNQKNEEQVANVITVEKSKMDSLATQEITETRITPELLWKFGRIFDSQVSPDGKTVVYCVQRYSISANKGYIDLFQIPVSGGQPVQLTDFEGPELNPRWSPDGKYIYFLCAESGSMQIWQMNTDGTDKKQVSETVGDINSFEVSPAMNHFLYTSDVKLDKSPTDLHEDLPQASVIIADDLMYRHWNGWKDCSYSHIFVAGFDGTKIGSGKDIMEGERWDAPLSPYFDNSEMSWSHDGKAIAYTCKKMTGKEYALSTNSDIYLYNIETGETKNLTEGMPGYDKYPQISPDGSMIAWQSMATPGYESDKDRLFVMNIASGEKQDITKEFDQSISNITWDSDNKTIFCISGIHATFQIYKTDVESHDFVQITKGKHDYSHFTKAGNIIIGEKMAMDMATEIFSINTDGNETQLSFTNANIYEKVEMAKSEERWVKTSDGKDMLVWVIYPPGFDSSKKYPALLYCQGGPQSAVSQFFSYRWNFQIMAANDYIIVAPNRRGLPTFGQEWNAQISGDYGGQNMKDYLSAIDDIKKEPFIDENKLGAIGASYGGFSVFWLAGHHEGRFNAFISHCGMFNLESQYAATEEMFFVNHDLGGPYWEKDNAIAQRSYANSPHKFVDKWDTPIMIISGGYDFRIPYTESLQAFNAAQLNGVESKLLIFPEESHFVLKPQNSILWQREFFGFLDKYLK
ncbi:MAG: S9 family peptidase [Bacteroidota bacterium]